MCVDISDPAGINLVSLDEGEHFMVVCLPRGWEVRKVLDDQLSILQRSHREFADDEGMSQNESLGKQSGQGWVRQPQMIDPDRGVGKDHSGSNLRLGAASASGSLPPRRARR